MLYHTSFYVDDDDGRHEILAVREKREQRFLEDINTHYKACCFGWFGRKYFRIFHRGRRIFLTAVGKIFSLKLASVKRKG